MTTPHDFPEDFEHENGMYQNRCLYCKEIFVGYKRRLTCKVCETIAKESDVQIEERVRRDIVNPFFSEADQLEIAIGSAVFKEKVILNLREQIKNLQFLLKDHGIDDIIIEQHQYKHLRKNDD